MFSNTCSSTLAGQTLTGMPTRLQLRRLELGYPSYCGWTPDPELRNRLAQLADVAAHHIAAEEGLRAAPAARAIDRLTDALREVLPRFLAEHAATTWLMLGPPGARRLGIVESVRHAAEGYGPAPKLPGVQTGTTPVRRPSRAQGGRRPGGLPAILDGS